MIREVECIETEGQKLILEGLESLLQTGVVVCRSWSVDDVSRVLVSESTRCGRDVRGFIEPRVRIARDGEVTVAALRDARHKRVELGLEARADACNVRCGGDAAGGSGLELIGLRELPSAENLIRDTARGLEGDVVDGVDGEDLTDIVVRVAAESFGVEEVGQEVLLEGAAVLRVSE